MSTSTVTAPPRPPSAVPGAARSGVARWGPDRAWLIVIGMTIGAALLRLIDLGAVSLDPFYDAAVRSMTLSWHNFFFGAFEPSASVSIDKPPVDLWLQVASVKLFGFGSTALKLPEALAGTASVPLLFAAVRRLFGVRAALAAALAIAVLPIEVLTARSDTMDAVMMALIALGLLLLVCAAETGSTRWLLLAAGALGLAFNVKLLESLVPLPGLALFAYLALPGRPRRRLLQTTAAAAVYVAVSLSWLTATLLFPAHDRPFAIGSTNGSAWNAAFVFNGYDRVAGKATAGDPITYGRNRHYPTATQAQRDHIPITPPSVKRLLTRIGPLSGERLGLEVLAGLLLGVPALAFMLRDSAGRSPPGQRGRRERARLVIAPRQRNDASPRETPVGATQRRRIRRGAAIGLLVWLATGIMLFSEMARLHPRYVEAVTPAVAAVLGVGVAWVTADGGWGRVWLLAGALFVLMAYAAHLLYGTIAIWWLSVLAAVGAIVLAALARELSSRGARRPAAATAAPGAPGAPVRTGEAPPREVTGDAAPAPAFGNGRLTGMLSAGALALTLVAILAIPLKASIAAITDRTSDAGHVGAIPSAQQRLISDYLRAHQGRARYEVAADAATKVGSLVVQDVRPVLILTTYNARTLTNVKRLQQLIAAGQVRYALLGGDCGPHTAHTNSACSAPVRWIRAHGTDVSGDAGLSRARVLWRLPHAIA